MGQRLLRRALIVAASATAACTGLIATVDDRDGGPGPTGPPIDPPPAGDAGRAPLPPAARIDGGADQDDAAAPADAYVPPPSQDAGPAPPRDAAPVPHEDGAPRPDALPPPPPDAAPGPPPDAGPAPPDAGPSPQCGPGDYPAGPYGAWEGSVMSNHAFQGYVDGNTSQIRQWSLDQYYCRSVLGPSKALLVVLVSPS
jgi:hypothetical protein